MNNRKVWGLLLCLLLLFSGCVSSKPQNIALNKNYTLSALPNYIYSAPSSDKTALTDGVYSKGKFWTTKSTVGWQSKEVTITIDLGNIKSLGAITFNTVQDKNSDVNFPNNVFVFISNDNKHFNYIGDIIRSDTLAGSHDVKKFILTDINKRGRYLSITIIPQGYYVFCDEIEVIRGKERKTNTKHISYTDLGFAIDSLKTLNQNRRILKSILERVHNISGKNNKSNDQLAKEIDRLSKKNILQNDLIFIKQRLGVNHAANLRTRYMKSFLIEKVNPWKDIRELHEPNVSSDSLNYSLIVSTNNVQYGAFVLINTNSTPQQFTFEIIKGNMFKNEIELFEVSYVSTSDSRIADPLIPVNAPVTLQPGITRVFIFKITGLENGETKANIYVHSSEVKAKIDIDVRVQSLNTKNVGKLNANVWAYLNYPMLKDRQFQAAEDLNSHHINTIVIPPSILPKMGVLGDNTRLINYLKNFKSINKILLYTAYSDFEAKTGYNNIRFMSTEWKNIFIQWYNNVVRIIKENGFSAKGIYFYPYDEIGGNDIIEFKQLISWSKNVIPGIKFYATFNNKEAIESLLKIVDIAQILNHKDLLTQLPPHQSEIWMYEVTSPARSLSPYISYRLQSWIAFVNNYQGIGFWNYADEGFYKQLNLITDPLLYPSNSYSVIYNGPKKQIISSRRWEAFRLGIEDFSILKAYTKKYGVERAKKLAQTVIDDPQDLGMADSVRHNMLNQLEL